MIANERDSEKSWSLTTEQCGARSGVREQGAEREERGAYRGDERAERAEKEGEVRREIRGERKVTGMRGPRGQRRRKK